MTPPAALKRAPWHWLAVVALAAALHNHHERAVNTVRLGAGVTEAKVEAMGQRLLDISTRTDTSMYR